MRLEHRHVRAVRHDEVAHGSTQRAQPARHVGFEVTEVRAVTVTDD
ncbi:MAG: hypothetical protein ACK56I_35485 [bacterium]